MLKAHIVFISSRERSLPKLIRLEMRCKYHSRDVTLACDGIAGETVHKLIVDASVQFSKCIILI